MEMSLEESLRVGAPAEEAAPEPADFPVKLEQSGEHVAELTPNAALLDPIGGLNIDTDTETLVPSPTRRASVSVVSSYAETSPRNRHKSALQ